VSETKAVNPFPMLEGHKNVNLTTFRKSGEPVVTPVWYVVFDGKLYLRTGANSGKVKRIRNDPRVQLAPSTVRGKQVGPTSEGRAGVLGSGEEELSQKALKLLRHRYMSTPIVELFIRGEESAIMEIVSVGT
jgi:uncharacterized protein